MLFKSNFANVDSFRIDASLKLEKENSICLLLDGRLVLKIVDGILYREIIPHNDDPSTSVICQGHTSAEHLDMMGIQIGIDYRICEHDYLFGCNRVLLLDEKPDVFDNGIYYKSICLIRDKDNSKPRWPLVAWWPNEKLIWQPHHIPEKNIYYVENIFYKNKCAIIEDSNACELLLKIGYINDKQFNK